MPGMEMRPVREVFRLRHKVFDIGHSVLPAQAKSPGSPWKIGPSRLGMEIAMDYNKKAGIFSAST